MRNVASRQNIEESFCRIIKNYMSLALQFSRPVVVKESYKT